MRYSNDNFLQSKSCSMNVSKMHFQYSVNAMSLFIFLRRESDKISCNVKSSHDLVFMAKTRANYRMRQLQNVVCATLNAPIVLGLFFINACDNISIFLYQKNYLSSSEIHILQIKRILDKLMVFIYIKDAFPSI